MNHSTSENIDVLNSGPAAGGDDGRGNHRALMVRENESHALSPYAIPATGAPFFEGDSSGINLAQLLHSLRRRWLLAMCAGLMMGVPLAIVVWLVAPDPYEVAAWLHVGDPQNISGGPLNRNAAEYDQYRKTQAAMIKSPQVLRGALDQPGIAELPVLRDKREPQKYLEEELSVVAPMDQELLQIKMRGKDAQQIVKIVNAVKQSYIDNIVNTEHVAKMRSRDMVDNNYKETVDQMQKKRELLYRLLQQSNAPDLEQVKIQRQLLLERSAELSRRAEELSSELTTIRSKIAMLKQHDSSSKGPSEHLVELALARDPTVSDLTQQIQRNQQVLSQHLTQITRTAAKDYTARQLNSAIEAAQKQLDERRAELRPGIIQQLNSEMGNGVAEQEKLEAQEEVLNKSLTETEALNKDTTGKAVELTHESSEHLQLLDEIKNLESNAAHWSSELDRLKVELSLPQRVTSLQDASVPEGTNPVLRYVLTMFAGIVGVSLGAGAVVAVEYQAHRLNTSTEIGPNAGLRVLGTVPNLSSLSRGKQAESGVMHGVLAESLDSIRTMLLQQSRETAPQIILITSAGDREGKTTVASHLAASLARSGRRTLLVDGDLRSPTAHLIFGASGDPGLCEVLRGETDIAAVLQPTSVDGLMLISGGLCDYNAIAALSKRSLLEFFQKAREQFDFIVIDAAPVLAYADTLLLGSHVDAAVLSVRRDISRMHKVNEARERMESVGIRVLGAVVNGITESSRRPAFALAAST